jgi:hypothetical protein
LKKHNFLIKINSTSFWKPSELFQNIQFYVSISKYKYLLESSLKIDKSTACNNTYWTTYINMHISNYFVARSLWPVNGILVYFTIWMKVASVRWFVIIWLQNPSLWNFSMRVSLMWLNAVPHICGILLVSWHLASVLWMFNFIINIHNLHPIHNRSIAFCSLHRTTIFLLRTTSLQLLCNGLECTKL